MRHIIILAVCALLLGACSTKDKALRQQEKALAAKVDSIKAVEAMKGIETGMFAVRFENLNFRHGGTFSVNPSINFIYVNGDKGAIQVASPAAAPGPNGIGGITLSGQVRNYVIKHDKKGNATATYLLSGYGRTATVTVKLQKGRTEAFADIDAGVGGMGMTANGTLSPYQPDEIVRGYPD